MTATNAIKKLEKAGFKVETVYRKFQASNASTPCVIEFFKNGGSEEIVCINVRRHNDNHDSQSDYCAGVWASNIKQAIELAAN